MAILSAPALAAAQAHPEVHNPLLRKYHLGDPISYHMQGANDAWQYSIDATGVVKKDPSGAFFEEFRWSDMRSNDKPEALSGASLDFKQQLSLDPRRNPTMPNLSQVDAKIIGPVTDMMTFYVDLWLAIKTGQLTHEGDHFYFKQGAPNSWADGTYVVFGQDSIDFDMTLKTLNETDHTAVLVVRHVPPEKPQIQIPAAWMQAPVADTANNWVQVTKLPGGKFNAAIGKETFDVEIKLSLVDGKILSGTLDNPIQAIQRECEDQALATCGEPTPLKISRKIEISLVH